MGAGCSLVDCWLSRLGNRWLVGDGRRGPFDVLSHFCVHPLACRGSGVAARHHDTVRQPSRGDVGRSELPTLVARPLRGDLQTFEGRADGLSGEVFWFS